MSVWRRLKLFRRNAGLFTSATFATVAILVTLSGVATVMSGSYTDPILLFWPVVAFSWVIRWKLLELAVRYSNAMRYLAALVGIAYVLRPKAGYFPGDEWIMLSVIALYFGLIFWWHSGSFSMILAGAVMPSEETAEDSEEYDEDSDSPDGADPGVIRHAGGERSTR